MSRKFHKFKLLLDEGFPVRSYFPELNSLHDIKHITQDFKKVGLSDEKVYLLATLENRIVITFNIKDFKPLAQTSLNIGVIGVSANLPLERIDKKLVALLNRATSKSLFGKLTLLSEE